MQPGSRDIKENIMFWEGSFMSRIFLFIGVGFFCFGSIILPAAAANTTVNATATTVPATTATTAPLPPVSSFFGSPTSGTAPFTVQFTDTSTNSPTSWLWDFGDGNTGTAENPSNTYTTAGTFTVSLTATNTAGSNTETQTDYITVGDVPEVSFYASETSGTAPFTVQFTDTSTNLPTSWLWDFGDGETSVEQSPSHTYTDPGTYTVSLTAVNTAGTNQATQSDLY